MIRWRGLIVNEEQEIGYREGEEIINQVIITTIKLLLIIIIIHKKLMQMCNRYINKEQLAS